MGIVPYLDDKDIEVRYMALRAIKRGIQGGRFSVPTGIIIKHCRSSDGLLNMTMRDILAQLAQEKEDKEAVEYLRFLDRVEGHRKPESSEERKE